MYTPMKVSIRKLERNLPSQIREDSTPPHLSCKKHDIFIFLELRTGPCSSIRIHFNFSPVSYYDIKALSIPWYVGSHCTRDIYPFLYFNALYKAIVKL